MGRSFHRLCQKGFEMATEALEIAVGPSERSLVRVSLGIFSARDNLDIASLFQVEASLV